MQQRVHLTYEKRFLYSDFRKSIWCNDSGEQTSE